MFNLSRNADDVIDRTSSIITDNVTNLSESIPQLPNVALPPLKTPQIIENVSQTNYTMYLIIFIILTLIGVNVFGYVAIIVDYLESIFGEPFRNLMFIIGYHTGDVIKQTVETSADGTKFAADVIKNVTVNTVDEIGTQSVHAIDTAKNIDNEIDAELIQQRKNLPTKPTPDDVPYVDRDELMMNFDKVKQKQFADREATKHFIEDDAGSTIQNGGPSSGQQGWCYIGEDRGFRSCMEVGANQECMSGDIFPTKQICVNPSLRE
tara:strand:+ start:13 stop:804 length:792 start_codon:yes stop_codon:yes gene_type:complete